MSASKKPTVSSENGISGEENALFLESWQPIGDSRMFLLFPFALIAIAIVGIVVFDNRVLAVFLTVVAISCCVFSVAFKNDERFREKLWLTGDECENDKIRHLNAFAASLESVGAVDRYTKLADADFSLEELTDKKAVFLFSTTQPGKPIETLEKPLWRISPVFRAYSTKFEQVDAVSCRITYFFENPTDRLGKTYHYKPGGGYE